MKRLARLILILAFAGPLTRPAVAQTPAEGKALFERLAKGHVMLRAGLGGNVLQRPLASISVRTRDWKRLKPREQLALGLYARSLVPEVRNNPETYLSRNGIRGSAPIYNALRAKIASMCDDCFQIMLVTVIDKETVQLERSAVQGDSVWVADPFHSGEKWTSFESKRSPKG
jgi:hypothetical protein